VNLAADNGSTITGAGVLLVLLLVCAVPVLAQPDPATMAAVADSLPTPNPEAVDITPVNLWNTGVNPTAAVVMTPLFPGWGQLYARNSWQGALGFGASMYFWTNMLVRDRRAVRANDFGETFPEGDPNREAYRAIADENWAQMRDFAWWSGGVLLITALDAYVGAHLFNFDQDPVPVPDSWDNAFSQAGGGALGQGDGPTIVVFQWRKRF